MSTPAEKLSADFRVVVADLEDLVRATAAQGGEKLGDVRARAEVALQKARETAATLEAQATARARQVAAATDQHVRENPWTAIGVAAGIGLAIGLLIGRR